jgi:hypothetical protein
MSETRCFDATELAVAPDGDSTRATSGPSGCSDAYPFDPGELIRFALTASDY